MNLGGEWVVKCGGGGTDSLSLSTNCRTTLLPPFLDKGQPLFCYLSVYSPLLSWIPKDSPLQSSLNDQFPTLNI